MAIKHFKLLIIFLLTFLLTYFNKVNTTNVHNINNDEQYNIIRNELKYLSELPLEKLLKVKKSLHEMSCMIDENIEKKIDNKFVTIEKPLISFNWNNQSVQALPFIANENRKMYSGSVESWDQKPSKIQNIFQLSITALAFLAFGGYLLCMIVQAIKSRGTTYYHPAMLPMTNGASPATLKSKRPYGRRKREFHDTQNNKTNINDDKLASPSPDAMYTALLLAAEGYVKLNQI